MLWLEWAIAIGVVGLLIALANAKLWIAFAVVMVVWFAVDPTWLAPPG